MVSRRVYFAVFGSGLGHVSRILDITERVRRDGDEFRYSCSGQAQNYLNMHGQEENVLKSPSFDVEWTQEGSFSSKDFIPRFPYMFNSFLKQIAFERTNISRFDPQVVVSDSRLSPVLAAREKSYPILTMLNQFKVSFPPRFSGKGVGRIYERFAGDVLGLLWSLSDEVLMTDLPPPYTIGEANLAGTDVSRIVRYVGFTSPEVEISRERLEMARRLLSIDGRPLAFFQISGPDVTKRTFRDTVLQATEALAKRYNIIISMGYPSGSGEPRRLANGAWIYDWCPIKDELFMLSSLVVARAGHRTIGQCIDTGKPAVLIPIHNHSEQIGNANKFSKLGLGIDIRSEKLTALNLEESVETCLNDSSYRNNVEKLRAVSKKYNGIGRCAEIIDSYT
jgi:UDP-N-acetylglucosamine--N-acetylmuramyl-(pentapeptide) pyrophosphoryl-undecaprenol N-acetylglucosamine transferase